MRSLVGHGIGRDMHEDPQIPNYGEPGRGPLLEEGMVLAVEPMVTAGRHVVRMGDDGWAIYSQDGSLAAHFEFTIAITADGPRILRRGTLAGGSPRRDPGAPARGARRALCYRVRSARRHPAARARPREVAAAPCGSQSRSPGPSPKKEP